MATRLDRGGTLRRIGERSQREPEGDGLAMWRRWFPADPSTRPISPFSKITPLGFVGFALSLLVKIRPVFLLRHAKGPGDGLSDPP